MSHLIESLEGPQREKGKGRTERLATQALAGEPGGDEESTSFPTPSSWWRSRSQT